MPTQKLARLKRFSACRTSCRADARDLVLAIGHARPPAERWGERVESGEVEIDRNEAAVQGVNAETELFESRRAKEERAGRRPHQDRGSGQAEPVDVR